MSLSEDEKNAVGREMRRFWVERGGSERNAPDIAHSIKTLEDVIKVLASLGFDITETEARKRGRNEEGKEGEEEG